jgi:hypothetical protein
MLVQAEQKKRQRGKGMGGSLVAILAEQEGLRGGRKHH